MKRHVCLCGLFSVAVLGAAAPARAAPGAVQVDVRQASLAKALSEFAREARVELLYDEALVRNLRAPPVRGRMPPAQALSALLAGSGVGYRATADGAFVLFALAPQHAAPQGEGAVAEVLVIGHRTQNADIRRTPDDIQAYKVTSRETLALAQHNNIDEFMRNREPANAAQVRPAQGVVRLPGMTRSEIDLRGIGTRRTLVLIDGRRIPDLPSGAVDFDQADLNGVPLGAIERIETLTSTAGGIYGPGAIGGVVNVILRRDYRGADFSVVSGLSDRGDAGRLRLEGRIGLSSADEATSLMLFASYAESQPLHAGQRDFAERSRLLQATNDPAAYLDRLAPTSAILVRSAGGPLRLDSQFGGAELPASFTYLPLDFVGSDAERAAALARNSGKLVVGLAPGHAGELAYLVPNPTVTSGIFNLRHRFSDHVEAYLDGLFFTNRGRTEQPAPLPPIPISAGAPGNPFDQTVFISFPSPDFYDIAKTKLQMTRFTAGVIASLPNAWRATADVAVGRAVVDFAASGVGSGLGLFTAVVTGLPGPNGLPALHPLGPFDEFRDALAAYGDEQAVRARLINNFSAASARASGPLFSLPAGQATATLLVEARREQMPEAVVSLDALGGHSSFPTPRRTQSVASAYGETRLPVIPEDTALVPLRGLELQLAVRNDLVATTFPDEFPIAAPTNDRLITVRHDATVFTAGARVFPKPWLMLRGSIATGQLPPNITQLQSRSTLVGGGVPDPRRGGQPVGREVLATVLFGGAHNISPEDGRTVSIGAVLNPLGRKGPRVSIDFSRITTDREIVPFPLSGQALLAAEAAYPERVVRAPLTQADIDRGFSVGPVLVLDTRDWNAGRTVVDSIDIQGEWTVSSDRAGELRAYVDATWQPQLRSQASPGEPWIERRGYYDGPAEWRGNAGLTWTRGSFTADINVQYFHSYRVATSGRTPYPISNAQLLLDQGADRIPAQAYVDVMVRKHLRTRAADSGFRALDISLGVQNLFDRSPPIIADPDLSSFGYSTYGDPRRRRFELTLSASF